MQHRVSLSFMRGIVTFAISLVLVVFAIYLLQILTWPKDELQCRVNQRTLEAAVGKYNATHPDLPLKEDIPAALLDQLGIQTRDHNGNETHYYFLSPNPHGGVMVKCSVHEINPLSLDLLGAFILALIVSCIYLSIKGYSFIPGSEDH